MTRDEFAAIWNRWQARVFVGALWVLAAIEVTDVILRWRGIHVELVSQSMRRIAFEGMTAIAFFAGSMCCHWFVTWRRRTWEGTTATVLGLAFWAVFIGYVLVSYLDPVPSAWPTWVQWYRYPPVAAAFGALMAWTCFPQRSPWFPGGAK